MQGHDTERIRNESSWTVVCVECESEFESKRHDASFCSGACRTRNARRPMKLQNAIEALGHFGYRAKETASKYPHNERVFEAMKALEKDIRIALTYFYSDN